jgi:hypothetical protein
MCNPEIDGLADKFGTRVDDYKDNVQKESDDELGTMRKGLKADFYANQFAS